MNLDGPRPDWLPKSPEHILNGVVCWVECCSINSWNGWSASICCCVRSHGCPCDPRWPMFFWTVHRPEWIGRKTVMSLTVGWSPRHHWMLSSVLIGHLPKDTTQTNTALCRITRSIFTQIFRRYHIVCPLGRGMGCLLWIEHLICILPQFLP